MEFSAKDSIYLSKKKIEKVLKIKNANEQNKSDAPNVNLEESKPIKPTEKINIKISSPNDSDKSDSDSNSNIYIDDKELDRSFDEDDQEVPPPMPVEKIENKQLYKQVADVNVFTIQYKSLETAPEEQVTSVTQCEKCQGYLNAYSNLKPLEQENLYEWTCDFCKNKNQSVIAKKEDIPTKNVVEFIAEKPVEVKKEKSINEDDYSLIFCYDTSGSMSNSYPVPRELKGKLEECRKEISKAKKEKDKGKLNNKFNQYRDYYRNDTDDISRMELVKLSVENNMERLKKESPNVKVGLVAFANDVTAYGDSLSNVVILKEKDATNEEKIISIGTENTNIIKNPIKESYNNAVKTLNNCVETGCTALGPAALLSISLLSKSKSGSRIFLCTDGCSNVGLGDISENQEESKKYYTHLGEMAKEKGIIISLITFEDSISEIEILMPMVDLSGGEIIRVNPAGILEGFNDLLENKSISTKTNLTVNLEKCLTFRNEDYAQMKNNKSSIVKEIGNANMDTETYIDFKFKKAFKIAEMQEYDFNNIPHLIFQSVIEYKKKNGGKYIRVITKLLKINSNKGQLEQKANFDIISTNAMQKVAFISQKGDYKNAQIQAHVTRVYLQNNKSQSNNAGENYKEFSVNLRDFDKNLSNLNSKKANISSVPYAHRDELSQQVYSLKVTSMKSKTRTYKRSSKK